MRQQKENLAQPASTLPRRHRQSFQGAQIFLELLCVHLPVYYGLLRISSVNSLMISLTIRFQYPKNSNRHHNPGNEKIAEEIIIRF